MAYVICIAAGINNGRTGSDMDPELSSIHTLLANSLSEPLTTAWSPSGRPARERQQPQQTRDEDESPPPRPPRTHIHTSSVYEKDVTPEPTLQVRARSMRR